MSVFNLKEKYLLVRIGSLYLLINEPNSLHRFTRKCVSTPIFIGAGATKMPQVLPQGK